MGDIIGGLIGGLGTASAAKTASKQALTGYNYLTSGAGAPSITQAQTAGTAASQAQQGTQGSEAQLLGQAPVTSATQNGFSNYLNSTGYNFQLGQGQSAIAGSAASKGILNSGDTAKALTQYGQNLATGSFNNYLGQLGSLNNQQGATATQGLQADQTVAQAGSAGGAAAANATQSGGTAAAGALGAVANDALSNTSTGKNISNWFGGL
jgi:hypothetical protein